LGPRAVPAVFFVRVPVRVPVAVRVRAVARGAGADSTVGTASSVGPAAASWAGGVASASMRLGSGVAGG
jgi:hypothetical protein